MFNRKTITGAVIGSVITTGILFGSAQAGLFNTITTGGWETRDTTSKYLVDVKGFDVRAYEWVSTENPNVRIVAVFGETSAGVTSYTVGQ